MIKKNDTNTSKVLCFIFVFFFIFGIKISFLDLSIVVPYSIAFLYISFKRSINFEGKLLTAAVLIAVLLFYQTVVQLICQEFEINSFFRLARALLVCVLLSAIVGSQFFSGRQILTAVFYSLLFHAALINIAAIFDPLNNFLGAISGNDRIKPLRSSGLLAGFDISGLLCLLGMLMLLLKTYTANSNLFLILYYLVFILGCFFTSRVSMALALVFLCFFFFLNLINSKKNIFIKGSLTITFIVIGYLLVSKYLMPILEVTFSLGIFNVESELRDDIVSRHAVQSSDSFLWVDMFFLPVSFFATIFGTGSETLNSDVGYIKDIFRYGIVGLLFSCIIYAYIFIIANVSIKSSAVQNKSFLLLIRIIFVISFVLTFKNNYIFTRAIFPLTLLMVCIPIVCRTEIKSHKYFL